MPLWPLILIALPQGNQPLPRFERLDSGLRVAIVEDHTLPLVSVQLWYRVGSACDPPSRPGLCHVVRTMLEHRDEAALKLRAAGVRFESWTLRDACCFWSVLPPNFLEYVLEVEAARMKPLTGTTEMIELGLSAAARQYAPIANDPNHVVMGHVLAAMFPDHPYKHPPDFVAQSLKNLSPDEANQFLERWFVPGNATLFVIGDVSTVRVLEQVRRRFGGLEWAEPPRPAEPKRLEAKTIRISVPHPSRAGVTIAWRTPPMGYFENAAIDVLMQHLCNEVDGLARQELKQRGVNFIPTWKRHAWRDGGVLTLSVDYWREFGGRDPSPAPDDFVSNALAKQIIGIVDQELRKAESQITTEIRHNRARALAELGIRERRAALPDRARELAEYEVVAGDLMLAELGAPRLRRVGVPDVQMAAQLLSSARRVIAACHPDPSLLKSDACSQLDRSLFAAGAQPADIATVFERLTGIAPKAPEIAPPQGHPNVDVHSQGPVTTRTCRIRGTSQSVLLTLTVRPSRVRARLERFREISPSPFSRCQREDVLDYMSYHGISLDSVVGVGGSGLVCLAPNGREESAVAWQACLLGRLGRDRCVEVIAVGEMSPARVQEIAKEYWSDWNPPRPSAEHVATEPNHPAPVLRMVWERDDRLRESVMLRLSIKLSGSQALNPYGGLAQDALALLLGRVSFGNRAWGADEVTPWQSWDNLGNVLAAKAVVSREAVEQTTRRIWSRLQRVRNGALPQDHIRTALELARSERLISLDSGWAIAQALWQNRENPWDIHEELTPERFVELIGPALRSVRVWIRVYSADDLNVAVTELEKELNASGQ